MELKEFVTEVFVQLTEGIEDAQNKLADKSVIINPTGSRGKDDKMYNLGDMHVPLHIIDFEVALTTSNKQNSAGGIGVFLGSLSAGAKSDKAAENTAITKIKFQLGVVFPTPKKYKSKKDFIGS
jgi:hypothetical protein